MTLKDDVLYEVKDWLHMMFGAHNDWDDRFFSWLGALFWFFLFCTIIVLLYEIPWLFVGIIGLFTIFIGPPLFFHYIRRIKR